MPGALPAFIRWFFFHQKNDIKNGTIKIANKLPTSLHLGLIFALVCSLLSPFSGGRFQSGLGTDVSLILHVFLLVFGTVFRYTFTTSMQDVAKWEHADFTRRRSDFNDFREVLVCEFSVCLLLLCFSGNFRAWEEDGFWLHFGSPNR